MLRHVCILSTTALITLGALPLAQGLAPDTTISGAAWAQDDDNGGGSDDDGGGFGGNGGGSDDSPVRRQVRQAAASPPPLAAEGEIVVTDLPSDALATLTTEGFAVLQQSTLATLGQTVTRLQIPNTLTLSQARDRVRALPGGEDADLNHFFRPSQSDTPDCTHENCAEHQLVGWPPDLDCATAQPIGLIDTGVNPAHDILATASIDLTRLADPDLDPSAAIHGTAVVSLLVGDPNSRVPGLLPGADVVAVDIFSRADGDERADVPSLLAGLDLLLQRGIRVVNLSLAGPENGVLSSALDAVTAADQTLLIAAAGNAGPDAPPAWPAAHPGVLAVTAVDARGRVYRNAQRGPHLDLAAPGVDLLAATSIRGARGKSGTSYAAPFVTAAAAVLLSQSPDLGAAAIAAQLKAQARDLGAEGPDNIFGAGLLDASGLCAPTVPGAE